MQPPNIREITPGDKIRLITGVQWVCERHRVLWTDSLKTYIGKDIVAQAVDEMNGIVSIQSSVKGAFFLLPVEAVAYIVKKTTNKIIQFVDERTGDPNYIVSEEEFLSGAHPNDVIQFRSNADDIITEYFKEGGEQEPLMGNRIAFFWDKDVSNPDRVLILLSANDSECWSLPLSSIGVWNAKHIIPYYQQIYGSLDESYFRQLESWALRNHNNAITALAEVNSILLLDDGDAIVQQHAEIRTRVEKLRSTLEKTVSEFPVVPEE